MTNEILSTIRYEMLIKIINIERILIFSIFFERFQRNRNASFKNDRNNKNDRIQIKNDSSTQFDKFKKNDVENSFEKRCENIDDKFKFNLCYNCDQIEHKTKECFESTKKTRRMSTRCAKTKTKLKIFRALSKLTITIRKIEKICRRRRRCRNKFKRIQIEWYFHSHQR